MGETILKPALTLDAQVERLENAHSLAIDNREEAREILSRVNYYRLSAYGIGLKRPDDPEKYRDGISLQNLYNLYVFDSHLRSSLLHIIEQIEIELRTQFAYHFSLEYGPEGYCDKNNFIDRKNKDGRSIHQITMEKFSKEVSLQSKRPCVIHHQQKYGGHFPLWAAIELFSFGMLSSFYSIMKPQDQQKLAKFYGVPRKHLGGWIQSLIEVRNICAHYGRLYNMPLSQKPYMFSEHAQYRDKKINKLFPVILVLRRLAGARPTWRTFYETLVALIDEYQEVQLSFIGFPNNWKEILGETII